MGASPDWTAQGELLGKHLRWQHDDIATDSLGRLQSVSLTTGHVVSYVYDGSNRRVGKKIGGVLQQGFLYRNAIKPVVELDGSGSVVSRFVYGSSALVPDYVIRGGNTYRIFTDQLGSPRVVVDVSSGSIIERIDYDERGNTLNDTNAGFIPFGFAGGIVDRDTGLIRFGARDYDPQTGRWATKDSSRFDGGPNFYQYANSDPINFIDPTGSRARIDSYPTPEVAGYNALADLSRYPGGEPWKVEYGGWIFKNSDNTYSYSFPTHGDQTQLQLPNKAAYCPKGGTTIVGSYHTHPDGDSDGPSRTDYNTAKYNYAIANQYHGYLMNAFGDFVSYDQSNVTNTITSIFRRPGR